MPKWWKIVTILLIAAGLVLIGRFTAIVTYHSCHSITEDSDITDCSYDNGTWSPN